MLKIRLFVLALLPSLLLSLGWVEAQSLTTPAGGQTGSAAKKEATQVLGAEAAPEEQQFAETIVSQAEALEIFGSKVLQIDTSSLTPGPIDPQTYLIAPGDRLLLEVWGEVSLNHELTVSPDMYVSVPDVGRIFMGGLTLREAEAAARRQLATVYASYIDPVNPANSTANVQLTPVEIQPVRFLVQGEVPHPGSFTLHPSLSNLVYALAQAGGVTENGSLRNIRIRRGQETIDIDFYQFLLQGATSTGQMHILPNDVIFVPLKRIEVAIRGEVRRPARYEVKEGESLSDVLNMAGGLKPTASLEKALILRTELNAGLQTLDVSLADLQKSGQRIQLQDQDVVNIFSTYLQRLDYVSVKGNGIALPGEYQLQHGMRLSNLIEEAGGLTGEVYLNRADLVRTRPDMTRYYETVDLRKVLAGNEGNNVQLENLDQLIVYTVREILGSDRKVRLTGHVKNPGEFEIYEGMTLFDLLFAKGGFQDPDFFRTTYQPRGDLLRIVEGSSTRQLIKFDLAGLMAGQPEANVALQNGDQIRVYSVEEIAPSDRQVLVSGHVKHPGSQPLFEGMRLSDLLEVVGGFQDREFRQETFLDRADLIRSELKGGEVERKLIRFNLGALLLGDDSQNHPLAANDEIVIYAAQDFTPERTVRIDGLVKRPGEYPYATNMTLGDLLVQAGGLLEGAFARVEISRMDSSSATGVRRSLLQAQIDEDFFAASKEAETPLKSNDHVFVRKDPEFEKSAVVEVRGEVRFPGRYVLKRERDRVSELIARAGGLTPAAFAAATQLLRTEWTAVEKANPTASVNAFGNLAGGETAEAKGRGRERTGSAGAATGTAGAAGAPGTAAMRMAGAATAPGVSSAWESGVEETPESVAAPPVARHRVAFDMEQALSQPGTGADLYLQDGDQLIIPPFENVVRVTGAVEVETTLAYVEGEDIDYYINQAGGFTEWANPKGVTITYPDGRVEKRRQRLLFFGKNSVEPMSVIRVPERTDVSTRF